MKPLWHLDYSFGEDENTTMDKTAFQNYSLLNKLVLTLCKLAQPFMNHSSIRVVRKKFSWNIEEYLLESKIKQGIQALLIGSVW